MMAERWWFFPAVAGSVLLLFFLSVSWRRLLPFLQWWCNMWEEDGELRKDDNDYGSVGVFVLENGRGS